MEGTVRGEYTLVLSDEEFHAVVVALKFTECHIANTVASDCEITEPVTSVSDAIGMLLDDLRSNFKI